MHTDTRASVRLTLLFKLLIVFIFFLPLRSVQVPIGVFGFEINPARLASVFMVLGLCANTCLDVYFVRSLVRSGRYRNWYIFGLLYYFCFSIVYYYVLVALGETILFGEDETSFLRNWRGRPFAQLVAFVTYGLIPFLLVQRYAAWERLRSMMDRTFVYSIVLLAYYALAQLILYALYGFYISGRNIFERGLDLGAVSLNGVSLYRVNSLAGEPRDFGTFLLGAIPLYLYARHGKKRWYDVVTVCVLVVSFFLTTSNSAYLALALFACAVIADVIYRRRMRIRAKYVIATILIVIGLMYAARARLIELVGERTIEMVTAIVDQIQTGEVQPLVREQTSNIVILYYLLHLTQQSPVYIVFGSGYSNFITPVADLYQRYFERKIETTGILTTDSAAVRLFVEGGVVGIVLYVLIYMQTLRLNTRLLDVMRRRKDRHQYTRVLLLRIAFIAFFVGGSVQNSFFYFIPMGLIVGWLNGTIDER